MSRRLVASMMVLALATSGAVVIPSVPGFAAPQPSVIPISWELTFKHTPIERVFLKVDGKDKPFWIMHYTVVNNSNRDVLFTPDFQLVTDTGQVVDAFDKN